MYEIGSQIEFMDHRVILPISGNKGQDLINVHFLSFTFNCINTSTVRRFDVVFTMSNLLTRSLGLCTNRNLYASPRTINVGAFMTSVLRRM